MTANTKVRYKYIPKRIHGISNKRHLLYDGKLDSSIDKFHVLRREDGKYDLRLTQKEKDWVVKELGISNEDLNTNNRNNVYLKTLSVEMPKQGLRLDVSQPYDFLIDRLLMAYDNVIAPDLRSTKHKGSYRFVRVFAEDEIEVELQTSDIRKKAYKTLGALEDSREKMIMYLLNEGKKLHPQITDKYLKSEVNKRMEMSHTKFLAAVDDPLFVEKGMLNMGIIVGVVDFKSNLYFYQGQPLAEEGEPATIINAATYLKSKKQAQIRVALSKETMEAFNKGK